MRQLYVRLSEEYIEKLIAVARQERRHPSDHAAILLEKVLDLMVDPRAESLPPPLPVMVLPPATEEMVRQTAEHVANHPPFVTP